MEQAFLDLRAHVAEWARGEARPGLRVFVYPPAWEATMLDRFPAFAEECAAAGWPTELVDVGQRFLADLARRKGLAERLGEQEQRGAEQPLHDLGVLAERCLTRVLSTPLEAPLVARILVNTGALGTFVSYSAILNALHDDGSGRGSGAPNVLAFPGEGDERSLNLLGLRVDTNYRVPRI